MARADGFAAGDPVDVAPEVRAAGRVSSDGPIRRAVDQGGSDNGEPDDCVGGDGDYLGPSLRADPAQHGDQRPEQGDPRRAREGTLEKPAPVVRKS